MGSTAKTLKSRRAFNVKGGSLLLVGFSLNLSALAQEPPQLIEEIVVTGSYIKRDNFDLASPIHVISQSDIEEEGVAQLGDVIKNLPFNYGTAYVSNSALSSQFAWDGAENLRGIGSTLTLLDGRRAVVNNANLHYPPIAVERIEILKDGASALYGNEAVAGVINYIPNTSFEGFKTSLYGLTDDDQDYDDQQIQAMFGRRYGQTHAVLSVEYRDVSRLSQLDRNDYAQEAFGFSFAGSPGNYFVPFRTASDADNNGVVSADEVGISRVTSDSDPGCQNPAVGLGDKASNNYAITGIRTSRPIPPICLFDFREYFEYVPDYETARSALTIDHEVNDDTRIFGEVLFARQDRASTESPSFPGGRIAQLPRIAGEHPGNPFRAFVDRNSNGIVDQVLTDSSLNETLFAQDLNGNGIPDRDINGDGIADVGAEANALAAVLLSPTPFDPSSGIPFNEDVSADSRFWRPIGKGPYGRPDAFNADGAGLDKSLLKEGRITLGTEFKLPWGDWDARVSYTEGRVIEEFELKSHAFNPMVAGLTASVVGDTVVGGLNGRFFNPFSTSQYQCTNRVCSDTPVDPNSMAFNTTGVASAFTFLADEEVEIRFFETNLVSTGTLFNLDTGPVEAAFGLHRRGYEREDDFAQHKNDCNGWQVECLADESVETESAAAFFELSIPVLTDNRWGDVDLQVAGRYSTEDRSDSESFDPKIGIRYQPNPILAFRGTWGTSFVAPTPDDPSISTGPGVQGDPTCAISGACPNTVNPISVRNAPNPGLKPEDSTNWNVGFTLQFLDSDLKIDLDYINIDFDDRFTGSRPRDVLDQDAIRFQQFFDANSSALSAAEIRQRWIDPVNKSSGQGESQNIIRDALGNISEVVVFKTVNAESVKFEGIDLGIDYRFNAQDIPMVGGEYGRFAIRVDGSYVERYDYKIGLLNDFVDATGNRNSGTGIAPPLPRWRANASFYWSNNNHSLRMTGRYTHHVREDSIFSSSPFFAPFGSNDPYIDSRTTWDLNYSLQLDDFLNTGNQAVLSIGGLNIFETLSSPMFAAGGIESYLHDPRGRLLFLRLNYQMD